MHLKLENEEITPIEYFTVHLAPVDNQSPALRVEPAEIHVPEGQFIELNTLSILLKDDDTTTDMIKICVKEQPSNGLIENISPAVGGEQSRQGQEVNKERTAQNVGQIDGINFKSQPIQRR